MERTHISVASGSEECMDDTTMDLSDEDRLLDRAIQEAESEYQMTGKTVDARIAFSSLREKYLGI